MQLEARDTGLTALLRNELSEIRELADALDSLATRLDLPDAVMHRITLAADELITNVINYGLPGAEGRHIHVAVEVGGGEVEVEIIDDGPAFDPFNEAAEPDTGAALEDRAVGGLGIHFVRTLLDRVAYERRDGRNHIKLSKSLPN